MWRLTVCFIASGWLLTTPSFGANPILNLSDLEKQAATDAVEAEKTVVATSSNETVADYSRYRMEEESNRLILAIAVMGTGLLALFLILSYLKGIGADPEVVVTGSGLVLVVFATVLIVILVKRDEQLTAATGILGAIAGYLFGKTTSRPTTEKKPAADRLS